MKASMKETFWAPEIVYHAYILRGYLNFRWDVESMFYEENVDFVKNYFNNTIKSEYDKGKVLNLINGISRKNIREKARFEFPDLFNTPETYPFAIPKRLKDKFGEDYVTFISTLKTKRKDEEMDSQVNQATANPVVNTNVDLDTLTLDNFQDKLGRRFRMTKEQKERGISRELALEEWKRGVRAGTVVL